MPVFSVSLIGLLCPLHSWSEETDVKSAEEIALLSNTENVNDLDNFPRMRGFTLRYDADENTLRDAKEMGANSFRLMLRPNLTNERDPMKAWGEMMERLPSQLEAAKELDLHILVSLFSPAIPDYREIVQRKGFRGYLYEFWRNERFRDLMADQAVEVAEMLKPFEGNVWLELKNEPLDWSVFPEIPTNWPEWAQYIIDRVREVSDVPIVVQVGPGGLCWGFADFPLLEGDNIIYSVHNYQPHIYTHQGIKHIKGTDLEHTYDETGMRWPGEYEDSGGGRWDQDRLREELAPAIQFAEENGVRIHVGEFGVARWAPDAADYLRDNIELFEEYGWDWHNHAFRESHIWSSEHNTDHTGFHDAELADETTDRAEVLMEFLRIDEVEEVNLPAEGS